MARRASSGSIGTCALSHTLRHAHANAGGAHAETIDDRVTRFKGALITGYTDDILIVTDLELMSVLWRSGLGAKNSQGFDMFDIRDEPIR
jgi:hypothetical protein